jgi:antitoxin HicB
MHAHRIGDLSPAGRGGAKGIEVKVRVPPVFSPQPEGGFTVTSPVLPELLTEGDTLQEANDNVHDALEAVIELFEEEGREIPSNN